MSEAKLARNTGLAIGALLASSATLVCCVLPAVLVAIGAGAALAGLVAVVPQLIWLSEHKCWYSVLPVRCWWSAEWRFGPGGTLRARRIPNSLVPVSVYAA